jgi:hypothetical protein
MSKTLLVVHHTPSPETRELLEAVLAGPHDPKIEGVEVEVPAGVGRNHPGHARRRWLPVRYNRELRLHVRCAQTLFREIPGYQIGLGG